MSLLIDNIGLLVTNEEDRPERANAALLIDDGVVAWLGAAGSAPDADERVDAEGGCVIPGFVDSHSHLMFAGDRADEFEARMAGRRYEAGGIRRTVALTREADDEQLLANARRLVAEMRSQGTTTVEIKSGYGLDVAQEARALRLARELTDETTFLGAHVIPAEYADRADDYVDLVVGEMLDACAPFARWIDVFIEAGAFDIAQARRILTAGQAGGLLPECTRDSSGCLTAYSSPSNWTPRALTTARFLSTDDIDALAGSTRLRPCCPAWSSRPGSRIRMPVRFSTLASPSLSRATAIPDPAIRVHCRSASPSPFVTWA